MMEKPKKSTPRKTISPSVYADRKGYDADFIATKGFKITMDGLLKKHLHALTPLIEPQGKNKHYLHYHNFTVAMNKARKMPQLTAVNIDGTQLIDFGRDSDKWVFDPRIPKEYQTPHEVYKGNDLDLGHLVRRLDPVWGEMAEKANFDTFHLTVCAPQHKDLNRNTWLRLEDYVLNNANVENLKISVFTGPIFTADDVPYDGVLLPLQFWKVAAMIKKDGNPSVSGYMLSQEALIDNMPRDRGIGDTGFGAFRTFQVPLSTIAEKTGIVLDPYFKYDPTNNINTRGIGNKKFEIMGLDDLIF